MYYDKKIYKLQLIYTQCFLTLRHLSPLFLFSAEERFFIIMKCKAITKTKQNCPWEETLDGYCLPHYKVFSGMNKRRKKQDDFLLLKN